MGCREGQISGSNRPRARCGSSSCCPTPAPARMGCPCPRSRPCSQPQPLLGRPSVQHRHRPPRSLPQPLPSDPPPFPGGPPAAAVLLTASCGTSPAPRLGQSRAAGIPDRSNYRAPPAPPLPRARAGWASPQSRGGLFSPLARTRQGEEGGGAWRPRDPRPQPLGREGRLPRVPTSSPLGCRRGVGRLPFQHAFPVSGCNFWVLGMDGA